MENKILKLVSKYNVEIELKYKKDTIIAIIDNSDETKLLKSGWTKNLLKDIETECEEMFLRKKEKEKDISKRLEKILPK